MSEEKPDFAEVPPISDDPKDSPKPKSNRRRLFILLAILVFSCAACGIIALFIPDSDRTPAAQRVGEISDRVDPTAEPAEEDAVAAEPTETTAAEPEPTEPPPTNTPAPTNTPEPTSTPAPTDTPVPTPTPTPPPEPIELSGTGDSVVDIDKWSGPAVVRISGNASQRHFAVISYDAQGNRLDLLVNTTNPYEGVRPLDFFQNQHTSRFEISATGPWQIEVLSLLEGAPVVDIPGPAEGSGDSVILLDAQADIATITGNAAGSHFAIIGYGPSGRNLMVNTTDPYEGSVQVVPGVFILDITAVGDWVIEFTAR